MQDAIRQAVTEQVQNANRYCGVADKCSTETALAGLRLFEEAKDGKNVYPSVEKVAHALAAEATMRASETNFLLRAILTVLLDGQLNLSEVVPTYPVMDWDDLAGTLEQMLKDYPGEDSGLAGVTAS